MVALVAILVIGPKELPRALRTAGQWIRKVRGIAREFQNGIDSLVREADLDDIKKEAESFTNLGLDGPLDPFDGSDGKFDIEARVDGDDGPGSSGDSSLHEIDASDEELAEYEAAAVLEKSTETVTEKEGESPATATSRAGGQVP